MSTVVNLVFMLTRVSKRLKQGKWQIKKIIHISFILVAKICEEYMHETGHAQ